MSFSLMPFSIASEKNANAASAMGLVSNMIDSTTGGMLRTKMLLYCCVYLLGCRRSPEIRNPPNFSFQEF